MAKEGLEYEISPKGQARTSPGHGEYAVVVPIMETESVVPAHPRYPRDVMKEAIMASDDVLSIISSTMPSGTCLTDMLASVRMGLTPSYTNPPNLSDRADTTEIQSPIGPRPIEAQADLTILISLPADVIHSLVKRYVQRILPIYPFLYEPAIWEHMGRAIEKTPKSEQGSPDPSVGPDYDFLFVYLILAISSTLGSANSGHEARCMAFSGSLFAEGSQHLSRKASFPNHLAEIQSTLLILQYALINPKYANVWILSGVVMRSCLELGLHREVSDAAGLDPATIDMRRRVFWTAYCIDRSICSALQRPHSIPDATINTMFPEVASNESTRQSTPNSTNPQRPHPTKLLALRQMQFAKLQSAILEVHFQNKPLEDGQTWEDWLAVTDRSLRAWYESVLPEEDHALAEMTFSQGITDLYRPSPRMPYPSHSSLLTAFEAACGSAQIYQQHITSGFFRRPWLAAHHTFSYAMVALFCLRYAYEAIRERWSGGEIFQMTKLFTMNLLALSAQGWSEISKYAGTYEKLLGPLLDAVFTKATSTDKSFSPAQDAELARLIYPDTAHPEKLRFGSSRVGLDDDYQEFDASLFNWDDDLAGNPMSWREDHDFWDIVQGGTM